jgi:outer membrane protein OmpA-like peptidoglycan-associated protein
MSKRRARLIEAFLLDHGIDADRIEVTWFGSSMPIASYETPESARLNDRIELNILHEAKDGSWIGGAVGEEIPTSRD